MSSNPCCAADRNESLSGHACTAGIPYHSRSEIFPHWLTSPLIPCLRPFPSGRQEMLEPPSPGRVRFQLEAVDGLADKPEAFNHPEPSGPAPGMCWHVIRPGIGSSRVWPGMLLHAVCCALAPCTCYEYSPGLALQHTDLIPLMRPKPWKSQTLDSALMPTGAGAGSANASPSKRVKGNQPEASWPAGSTASEDAGTPTRKKAAKDPNRVTLAMRQAKLTSAFTQVGCLRCLRCSRCLASLGQCPVSTGSKRELSQHSALVPCLTGSL